MREGELVLGPFMVRASVVEDSVVQLVGMLICTICLRGVLRAFESKLDAACVAQLLQPCRLR